MPHSNVITTIWDDPQAVDTLRSMWDSGSSASQIARVLSVQLGTHITRNSVIGKISRLKLAKRVTPNLKVRTLSGSAARKGNAGNPGQAKANTIIHRIEGRQKAERARPQFERDPSFPLPADDEGVDVTSLVGFADRRINHQCAWVHGDPIEAGAGFCGKPVVAGSQWCPEHHARVYSKTGAGT